VDPSIEAVRVGDYGYLNDLTGVWEPVGNIFKDKELSKGIEIHEGGIEHLRVSSDGAKVFAVGVNADADLVTIAGANASVKYEFTDGRGVLVGAIQMKGHYLEFEDIRRIMEEPRMKVDKIRFVTQVWEAPAYVTYMSDKTGGSITLSVNSNLSVPVESGVAAGSSSSFKWNNQHSGGLYREGCHPETKYWPFFSLVKRRGFFREAPLPPGVRPKIFEDGEPAWGDIDSDGEDLIPADW